MKLTAEVEITNIDWDTDGIPTALPTYIKKIMYYDDDLDDLEELIGDWLSDYYGYCHNGFEYEVVCETECEYGDLM